MISLRKVNKYFYRHKKNEIHVINDTSIDLNDTGLIALLGPSGCGKTTLLNAIGGLDKINTGEIYINGERLPKVGSAKIDKIRVLNIGYIFQNYNLLDNLSVFDNVAISLKMIGIKNREEIKKRVDFILESVDMYRYRNKAAGNLSGGQRQRVGIARALVKNPEVIIADEPTGNLDSKNTIEIMNIIKAISKTKLVILVTHEKELAHFYASRIIEIEDGKIIKDYSNEHENELDYRIDNKIYLKDFKNSVSLTDKKAQNVNIYSDQEETLNLDIVVKNGNIFIKSNEKYKIEVVDEQSNIEFIDDYYKKISKEDYQNKNFDLSKLDNANTKLQYTSIYNVYSMLKTGFKKVSSYTVMKKVLLIGFFVSAMFIAYSICSIFGSINIKDENFLTTNKNYITIKNGGNNVKDIQKLESLDYISYVIPGDSTIKGIFKTDALLQLSKNNILIEGSLAGAEMLRKDDLIYGELPTNKDQIVLDKMIVDSKRKTDIYFRMINIDDYEGFIGKHIKIGDYNYEIVGISDSKSPCLYFLRDSFYDSLWIYYKQYGYINKEEVVKNISKYEKDVINIKEGREPNQDYEALAPINLRNEYPLNSLSNIKINGHKLKIVGYYTNKNSVSNNLLVNDNTQKYNTILSSDNITIYAKDKEKTLKDLKDLGYNAIDTYETAKQKYIENRKSSIIESLVISGILLFISFIEIFLMIRASFLSRIKEVGIYRAIGVKKADIYKMFLGEILIITTIAGLTGSIFMNMILNEIIKSPLFSSLFVVDFRTVTISILLVYALNILVGLLPIMTTIRKTPAEILSRNDID